MCEQQVQRGFAQSTMGRDGAIVPDGSVDQRNPSCEHEHDENEVGSDQPGNDAEARDGFGRCRELAVTARGEK